MKSLNSTDVLHYPWQEGLREHRIAVFGSLSPPDADLAPFEVHISYPEREALYEAHTAPVEERGHELCVSPEYGEYATHLSWGEHYRKPGRRPGARECAQVRQRLINNVFVEKE